MTRGSLLATVADCVLKAEKQTDQVPCSWCSCNKPSRREDVQAGVLSLWVVAPLGGVTYQRAWILDIYITIPKSRKITIIKYQQSNFRVWGNHKLRNCVKGPSIRKVENTVLKRNSVSQSHQNTWDNGLQSYRDFSRNLLLDERQDPSQMENLSPIKKSHAILASCQKPL